MPDRGSLAGGRVFASQGFVAQQRFSRRDLQSLLRMTGRVFLSIPYIDPNQILRYRSE